jgi:phage shock protein PspC (stress-responsive transcriptional regulator)
MQSARTNLFTRPDTMFGVCQGLGEDFGFNPNYLRLAFPLPLFLYPVATVAAYLMLGVIVFAVRWFMPNRLVRIENAQAEIETVETVTAVEDYPLSLAA